MNQSLDELFRNQRQQTETISRRVRTDQRHSVDVLRSIEQTADMRAVFLRKRMQVEDDQTLSTVGRQGKIAELARSMMPDLARVSSRPRKAMAYHASVRAGLMEPTKVDPTDMVGELRRQEIRTYMRGLAPHERMALANSVVGDEMARSAILDAPPFMTGLAEPFYKAFRDNVAEHVNGEELARINAVDEDYQNAMSAAHMLRSELVKHSGLTERAFADAMTPLEVEADKG